MHTPGIELDLINPKSHRRYLFEDAVDQSEFRRQHKTLVDTLRGEGVDVCLLGGILQTSPLIESIRTTPNLVYTRDTVTVTPAGYIAMRMKSAVRRHEPRIAVEALGQLNVEKLTDIKSPATMEGGDLIFLDEETLMVGVGNRTDRVGLRQLREQTRTQGLRTLVAVQLPPWVIHLDGTMMIVDEDLAIVHPESLSKQAVVFEEGQKAAHTDVFGFLKKRGLRLVEVTGYERQRRATNVITLGPRRLVGYGGNARVRNMLRKEGADFVEIDGSELVRGGGGPRCMTAPILRD